MGSTAKGPLGIDPIHFTAFLLGLLALFVLYLLLPRGFRVHHFGAYPKRYAWSARSRSARRPGSRTNGHNSLASTSSLGQQQTLPHHNNGHNPNHRSLAAQGIGVPPSNLNTQQQLRRGASNRHGGEKGNPFEPQIHQQMGHEETLTFDNSTLGGTTKTSLDHQQNDEIVISAAMQQLRDPGVLIIAHGSKGKPKTVRLQLTESAITWRTETRKKGSGKEKAPPKMGKLHQVPLAHIMYVDVGKQTTALRRVENAHVSEALCFSLLTKEGSLDLEANSARERDALVSCFSLVLDEIHAQNWRDIYRGPSSDMPSSFDDFETDEMNGGGGMNAGQQM
mmetsp:Transcript_46446/g.68643  ORF Transcript_46446/g.68643 Transcript_46446/m.68643 type:complete len:336 (-) Transcript_46446:105-1112(-)|eukprot:CAMPEP_0195523084 /NCGR_PEP_ID=MMETSP0794_2-20130614/21906_1 /TAXON_ID=515487 /ORGANISM="Stephanopyxis turris, Strain CCMP 815" /LENGTH=335 /DNA_ID=CAMNT_0040652999 /DNA_START=81 /DNA_END=1088 /DNA_ORIENTATION=-